MIEVVKLSELGEQDKKRILKRGEAEVEKAMEPARKILEDVKAGGDAALVEYTKKFDGVDIGIDELRVSKEEIDEALENTDSKLLRAIERAYRNIKRFHENQVPKDWRIEVETGVETGRRVVPMDRAGLYVPGGKAVYPSVMLMLAVPAKIAGVGEAIVCTPPRKGGTDPASLIAARLCGVDAIFKVGGVQAIGAMAYGTETIPKADVIAGPGGPYVSAAQRLVGKEVRVDFPPGPSEGMVIADKFANPKFVAADVLSEAEHGPDSAGVLVTDSPELARKVSGEFEEMAKGLPKARKGYVKENVKKYSYIILTKDIEEAIGFVD
ncbi:MAG: histidinol dehydrogenase, partial [Candidatus Altiarchaeota archaeon]|nr:histidinol dehydrogenase [Candidatus Altiarchaeota archaeon]